MTPTVHDVVGAPVAAGGQVAPRTLPPAAERFQSLLKQLLAHSSGRTGKPSASAPRATAPVPFHPHLLVPHASRSVPTTKDASAKASDVSKPASGAARAVAAGGQKDLRAAIRHASATVGVEPGLSVAIARAESNLNPHARSQDGRSVGTFQVTHTTAAELRKKIATGAVARAAGNDDVALGVSYLRYLHDLFGREAKLGHGLNTVPVGDASQRRLFAVAAYNAGEGRVAQAQAKARAAGGDPTHFADIRRFLPDTTRGYVQRVAGYVAEESPAATSV